MYLLHWSFKGRPLGNNVSTACQLPSFYITKDRTSGRKGGVFCKQE